jgi:hypothetical protein
MEEGSNTVPDFSLAELEAGGAFSERENPGGQGAGVG